MVYSEQLVDRSSQGCWKQSVHKKQVDFCHVVSTQIAVTHPAHQRVWLERQFGYDYSAQKTIDRKDQRNVEDAEVEVVLIDPAGQLSVVVF